MATLFCYVQGVHVGEEENAGDEPHIGGFGHQAGQHGQGLGPDGGVGDVVLGAVDGCVAPFSGFRATSTASSTCWCKGRLGSSK